MAIYRMTDDRRLMRHVQAGNTVLQQQISALRTQLNDAKQLVVVQRYEIYQERGLLEQLGYKTSVFERYHEGSYPSLYYTRVTADLLKRHISVKSLQQHYNVFITQQNKLDSLKLYYKSALYVQENNRAALAAKKSDRDAILLEMLGYEQYSDYVLFEAICKEEGERFDVLRSNIRESISEIAHLQAYLATLTRETAIYQRFLRKSRERFEQLETVVARCGHALTVTNLLFNPNAVDTTWIGTEGLAYKRTMLHYCLRLGTQREKTETTQLHALENAPKPIRFLMYRIYEQVERRDDLEYVSWVISQLYLNRMQIIEVLKLGGLSEVDFQ